jgi:trimeric autotransporter adhesin
MNPSSFFASLAKKSHSLFAQLVAFCVFGLFMGLAPAAPPPANAVIGNQATANYTDSTGTVRNVTSNLVQTTVAQVYGHSLTANMSKQAAQGSTVYFPHVLTNTGNGADTYVLSNFNGSTSVFSGLQMFADANGDGVPDDNTPITSSGIVAAGAEFRFVVAAAVIAPTTSGSTGTLTVGSVGNSADTLNNYTASSTPATGAFAGVLDTAIISNQAIINVNKSFSVVTGPTGTSVRVTLNYTNVGGAAATNLVLTDALGSGTRQGLVYTAASGRWSVGAAIPVVMTDALAGDGAGINYTASATGVTATISTVLPGDSGQVSFDVTIAANAAPGTSQTTNSAGVAYNNGVAVVTDTTNSAIFNVLAARGVALFDQAAAGAFATNGTDLGGRDDIVMSPAVDQGGSYDYRVFVVNQGQGVDTFNLSAAGIGSFPAGTTFAFYNAATNTLATSAIGAPMTDSNGDGTVDTGPLSAGQTATFFVRVILPVGAVSNTTMSMVVSANSVADATAGTAGINSANPEASRDVRLSMPSIISKVVDLTNNTALCTTATGVGAGFQATGEASAVCSKSVDSGQKAVFKLLVANKVGSADNYDLLASSGNTLINSAGFTGNLPSGWSVEFRRASAANGVSAAQATTDSGGCDVAATLSAMPNVINTGNINGTSSMAICAVVTTTANSLAGNYEMFFRVASPVSVSYNALNTASFDVKHDQIVLTNNAAPAITITPNRVGQVYPGGNVVYSHQVCNTSLASIATVNLASALGTSNPSNGWTSALYLDNTTTVATLGVLDPTDTALASGANVGPIAAGACVTVLNNVFAPLGAQPGAYAVHNLTGSYSGGPAVSVTDNTQVIVGDVALQKSQAYVAPGVCALPGSYVNSNLTNSAPGGYICYQIVATNKGVQAVTGLTIQDVAPQYTTITGGACAAAATGSSASLPVQSGQSISTTAASVVPLGTVQLNFCVQIQQ